MLFSMESFADINKPIKEETLKDPNSPVTKHILYLYSMESFIYEDLNRACREKDKSMIQYYGAFAAALSFIIYHANVYRTDEDKIN